MHAQFTYLFLGVYLAFLGSTTPGLFRYLNTSSTWNLANGFSRSHSWTECPNNQHFWGIQECDGEKSQNWEVGRSIMSSALPVTSTKSWISGLLSGALNSSYKNTDLTNTSNKNPQRLVLVFHTCHKQSALRWQPEIQSKDQWHMSQQFWMSNLNGELRWSFMF